MKKIFFYFIVCIVLLSLVLSFSACSYKKQTSYNLSEMEDWSFEQEAIEAARDKGGLTIIDNNTCKIKYSDYLKEYNYRYKTSYEIEEYDTFLINLTYSSKYITKISYDYTLLNKIISNNESNVNYLIRISNINKNNFSDQFEYFDNLIEKKN